MSKGGNQVQETSQQRALADYATAQMADYKARWLPVQQNLAAQITEMGKDDSSVRTRAEGRAATDTAARFGQVGKALEKQLSDSGAGVGSSRGKLAIAGLGDDQAKSKGLGITLADQQIDDAYTQGLGAIAAAGRGERQAVGNALADQAETSARQATLDAEMALNERIGTGQVVGQAIGLGAQQYLGRRGGSASGLRATDQTPDLGPGTSGGYVLPSVSASGLSS